MPLIARRTLSLLGLILVLLLPASAALAHEEREVKLPDGTGSVPVYRQGEPDLLVCKTDKSDFQRRIAKFPDELRQRNLRLFARCQKEGFRHLQEAVDRVDGPGMNIAILPGLYLEEPGQPAPTGECADLEARWSSWGYQILSYEQQVQCPHNQNLVAILGKKDLQIEGTGAGPLDVIIDAQYRKLNAIRADMTDGVYFRNFTAQRTTFNSLYILATDGFVIDRMLTRWNDEYGFLTFASDHGLYTDCESYGNGDSGIYPGSASNINDGLGYEVPRYAIEIRRCKSHHNMVGYSGTAGDSVWVHDSEFWGNLAGATMDSAFPGTRACRRTTPSSRTTRSTTTTPPTTSTSGTAPAPSLPPSAVTRRAWSARRSACRPAAASSPRAATGTSSGTTRSGATTTPPST